MLTRENVGAGGLEVGGVFGVVGEPSTVGKGSTVLAILDGALGVEGLGPKGIGLGALLDEVVGCIGEVSKGDIDIGGGVAPFDLELDDGELRSEVFFFRFCHFYPKCKYVQIGINQ